MLTRPNSGGAAAAQSEESPPAWQLDWTSDRRNAVCELSSVEAVSRVAWPPLLQDLVDIATTVYLADVAAPRGHLEEWVRTLHVAVSVRDVEFWRQVRADLTHLLTTLSRDNISLELFPWNGPLVAGPGPAANPPDVDCVCLLSGGLDSLAGAVMLVHTGRRPLLVSHQSGNPTVEAAQRQAVATVERLAPGRASWAGVQIAPMRHGPQSLPYPAPEARESSRRLRSFLFMALGTAAAVAAGVTEVYLCENGILTAALPLTPARCGSLSTRSTHPLAIKLFQDILEQADLSVSLQNPFLYQTKAEVLRAVLKPLVPPAEIARTVSCWSAGRQNRQCGGCIPCLLRRVSMLSAGLPDEAYMMDVLRTPEQYRGTDAYGNLVDLLTQAGVLMQRTELDLLLEFPQLLDLDAAGVSVEDMLRTLRRHAAEVYHVVCDYFPASAVLMGQLVP